MSEHPFVVPSRGRRVARALGPLAPAARWLRNLSLRVARTAIAAPIGFLLALLPLGVRLRVIERLQHSRRAIDLADATIHLEVRSESERQRLRPCAKEPETVEWLLSHARAHPVLYDVGANVGVYSLIAAAVCEDARVFSFEPGYATYPRLVDNIRVNSLSDRIVPLQLALSDRTGLQSFGYATLDPGAADHPGVGFDTDEVVARHPIICFRLDDLIAQFGLPHPTLLKLDVDGAELAVLRGAPETLRAAQMESVLVEVREGSAEAATVQRILTEAGFAEVGGRLHDGGVVRNQIWSRCESRDR